LEKLTSVFELYVAINSAYIISQHFTKALIANIFGILQEIQDDYLGKAISILKSNKDYLQGLSPSQGEAPSAIEISIYKSLLEKHDAHEEKFKSIQEEIEERIHKAGISKAFNFYCLLSALFSFCVLISIGFEINFHEWNDDGFFVFCMCHILFFFLFYKKQGNLRVKIFSSGYTAAIAIVLMSSLIALFYSFLQKKLELNCPIEWYEVNKVIATAFPSLHFIYYFGKSYFNKRRIYPMMMKSVNEFITELERFGEEAKVRIDTIKQMNNNK